MWKSYFVYQKYHFWLKVALKWTLQWIRGGGRGGGPRLSPPECLSDPLLGRHLYVKIRVGWSIKVWVDCENLNGPGNKISLCGKWVSETGAGFAVARLLRLLVRLEKSGDFDWQLHWLGQYEPEDSNLSSKSNRQKIKTYLHKFSASRPEWIQLGGGSGLERLWGFGQTFSGTPVQGWGLNASRIYEFWISLYTTILFGQTNSRMPVKGRGCLINSWYFLNLSICRCWWRNWKNLWMCCRSKKSDRSRQVNFSFQDIRISNANNGHAPQEEDKKIIIIGHGLGGHLAWYLNTS